MNTIRIMAVLGNQTIPPEKAPEDDNTITVFGITFSVGGFIGTVAGSVSVVSIFFICCCWCCCCGNNRCRQRCCGSKPKPSTPQLLSRSSTTVPRSAVTVDNSRLSTAPLNFNNSGGHTEQSSGSLSANKGISDNQQNENENGVRLTMRL
jgi:hypothetical protein